MHHAVEPTMSARLAFRRQARVLLREPSNRAAHTARLHAALEMPGAEPAQGALADVYVNFGAVDADFKRSAWQLVRARLAAHHARFFDAQTDQAPLPVIHPLATRWSVLARSSADISTRARRCSGDDSRALAADMVAAVERADVQAQQAFLHHCITCHDNLAFMLVRRALQHSGAQPPLHWDAVSLQLQHAQGVA